MAKKTTQLIIKQRSPLKSWLVTLSYLLVAGVGGYGLYKYGEHQSGFNNADLKADLSQYEERIAKLDADNAQLRGDIALKEQSRQVEKQAYEEVDVTLKTLQQEILELKEQVEFYRGIVSPTESENGVNIQSFKVNKTEEANVYNFKLVLTQVIKSGTMVKGRAEVVVEGVQDGKARQIPLEDLSGGAKNSLEVKFMYFQTFKGNIILPEGFLPSRIQVAVNPTSRGASQVKKTFDWVDLVS